MKYKYSAKEAKKINKHGIDLTVYPTNIKSANVVYVSLEKGHFQELLDKKSWYIYYIIEGKGTFFLNGEKVEVQPTDILAIPPKTRIHYFGKMKMVLTTTPAFNPKNEEHIRFINESEASSK